MVEGDTYSLVATVLPSNAEYEGISWASSNTSVAIVNQGTITALKEGKTTITASAGGKSATCSVTVSAKYIDVASITLDKAELTLRIGNSDVLTATVKPDDATDKSVTWASSDASVVKVDNGKVTALKSGIATISATSGIWVAQCIVTVLVETESISLDKRELTLAIDETATLTATITPVDATDKKITWTSSNESVADVYDGIVTAIAPGTATITAECGGHKAECVVKVFVPTQSVTLDKTSLELPVGKSYTLTATVKPDNAADKNVTWSSSDESIATVANGKVTAIKQGTATITAECSGKKAECEIIVIVPATGISLDKDELSIDIGETATLTAAITPADATNKTITWTSSNDGIVKVNDGAVKGIQAGTATITATISGYSASCGVTVTVPNNIITYTSTYGEVVTPYNLYAFGANIVSNEYADGLGKIVFDGPVIVVGSYAFKDCRTLKTVYLPNAVTKIEKEAFSNSGLEYIDLPESLSYIGYSAFCMAKLSKLICPTSLKTIESTAFFSAYLLKDVKLNYGLQSIGSMAFSGTDITEIVIPETVTFAFDGSFYGCESLKTLKFDEGIRSVSASNFGGCPQLTDVIFPSTIKKLSGSFSECVNLTNVYLKATTPPSVNQKLFIDSNNATIWVPMSAVETYKKDAAWEYWSDRIKGCDY